jgi:lipid A 3-O-deacylase
MHIQHHSTLFVSLLMILCTTSISYAHDGSFSFILENDIFTNSDNNYTNGIGFSWTTDSIDNYQADSFVRQWVDLWDFLPFMEESDKVYAAWTLGQEMNTPNDISDPMPPKDDQPYSGILYLDSIFYAHHKRWAHAWHLRLGMVGSSAGAEQSQKEIHKLINSPIPQGWHTQLPNELIVNAGYSGGYLLAQGKFRRLDWRIVPIGSLSVGNYSTALNSGIYFETGWNLANAFGLSALRSGFNTATVVGAGPQNHWSLSFFAAAGGHLVAHYMPLDGTLFRDSRSVDSKPLVGAVSTGLALRHKRFVGSFGISYFSDTFENQRQNTEFGTFSFSWYF